MPEFEVTMGGYDIKEVDQMVMMVDRGRDSPVAEVRDTALEALRSRQIEKFRRRYRGYSKIQVRNYIEERIREISRL